MKISWLLFFIGEQSLSTYMKPPLFHAITAKKIRRALFIFAIAYLLAACEDYLPPSHSLEIASKGLYSADISDNGTLLAIGSINHGGSLWRLSDSERLFNWNHKNGEFTSIISTGFSRGGKQALTADSRTLVLWNADSGQAARYWIAPADIFDLEFSTNGQYALLGLNNNTAVIFDVVNGGVKRRFQHSKAVVSVSLSADSKLALSGSIDQTATLWNVASGERIASFRHQDEVPLVKLSPDGTLAFTVGKYDKAILWNAKKGEKIAEVPLQAQRMKRGIRYTSACFSKDNKYLLTGRPDQIVTLWNTDTLEPEQHWKLPKRQAWKPVNAAVLALAFGQDTNTFIAVSSDGFVHQLRSKTQILR